MFTNYKDMHELKKTARKFRTIQEFEIVEDFKKLFMNKGERRDH